MKRPVTDRTELQHNARMSNDRSPLKTEQPMRIALSGSSGLLGSALSVCLTNHGHTVVPIVRASEVPASKAPQISMHPARGIAASQLEGIDAVIHLAGAGIADRRWSAARKREILESRVRGTRFVAEAMATAQHECSRPPRLLLSASAVGYYGATSRVVDETSGAGLGFLADVVQQWEDASRSARDAGIRVVHLRFGVILAKQGGALGAMLRPFRLGLGGPLGNGQQGFPWVSRDDAMEVIRFCLNDASIEGAVNVVAPAHTTQREFARSLGKALRRPAFLPMPAWVVGLLFGEMGRTLLLEGAFVAPSVLTQHGFQFKDALLADALRNILKQA